MNRLEFYKEHGKTCIELQDVKKVGENEARGVFSVKEKPVYLTIFFHCPVTEYDLRNLYNMIMAYDLVEGLDENREKAIQEDLAHQDPTLGVWEFKCDKFQDAFECCYDALAGSYMVEEGIFSFQLSDEPSEQMKNWLNRKTAEKAPHEEHGL